MTDHEIAVGEHLTYDELERWTDGSADTVERELAAAHLSRCPRCTAEAADLAKMAEAMRATGKPRGQWWLVAAAVLVLAVTWLLMRGDDAPQPVAPVAAPRAVVEPKAVTLAKPAILATLVRPAPVLRGDEEKSFALRAPVGTVVTDDRPQFVWEAVAGARSYDVVIADANGEVVATGTSREASWRPLRALQRDRTYTWQVTAKTDAGRVRAPGAAGAEALFHVGLHGPHGTTPRERGIELAQMGALDEAERELERAGATDLLAQVRSWRVWSAAAKPPL
jgi:hypothetical protein